MAIKKHIPNAITCCNLLCGCLAIVQAFDGNLVNAAYLVGLAAIFDFFDGFAARILRVASPIGKDLDSLADMVTFGLVPGLLMFKMIIAGEQFVYNASYGFKIPLCYISFLIPIFSAIRLAKFNNDTRQSNSFIGLPTPANAIFICSIIVMFGLGNYQDRELHFIKYFLNNEMMGCATFWSEPPSTIDNIMAALFKFIFNPYVLSTLSIVLSFLLVAELPLFALKFRNFSWRGNRVRYTFLALSLVLLITLQFVGIPLIIVLYVLMSVVTNLYIKKRNPLA